MPPVTALPAHPAADQLVTAAYGLAVRITADEDQAADVLLQVPFRPSAPTGYLNAVRRAARTVRPSRGASDAAQRPARLSTISPGDWDVVERIALRGLTVTEVAQLLELDRREVVLRLNRGLAGARAGLLGGQTGDDPHAARVQRLDGDGAARSLRDATRNRQTETAPTRSATA